MKLGVLQFFSWPERRVDLATVYARALERIEIMDRTGYDAVWLAEHHFLRARQLAPRFGLLTCLLDSRSEVSR